MPQLNGSPQPVSLGGGYAIRAPGVRGTADLERPRPAADRARSRTPADGTDALARALAATNVTEVRQVELRLQPAPPTDATRGCGALTGRTWWSSRCPISGRTPVSSCWPATRRGC
jgi:hypothetical protein